jgi:hypothetical protein
MLKRILLLLLGLCSQPSVGETAKMPKFYMVYLKWDWTVENKVDGTAKLSKNWSTVLEGAQMKAMMLPMGAGKIIMIGEKLKKARQFILQQPEVD